MSTLVPFLVAALLAVTPPPPWVEDAATQILARAMVEEARRRTGITTGEVTPNRADLVSALSRCLENTDNLLLLSGLKRVPQAPPPLAAEPLPERPRTRRVIKLSDVNRESDSGQF